MNSTHVHFNISYREISPKLKPHDILIGLHEEFYRYEAQETNLAVWAWLIMLYVAFLMFFNNTYPSKKKKKKKNSPQIVNG